MTYPKCKFCTDNPDKPMHFVWGYDDPHPRSAGHVYAWNLFVCEYCGAICKQDVWHNAGEIWVTTEGRIESKVRSD